MTPAVPSAPRHLIFRAMRFLLPLLLLLLASAAGAQRPAAADRLPVFLDCRASCDFDFLRAEIGYVDWVRDRAVADVHLLVTSQGTGAGGAEYTVAFLGLRAMGGRGDTLTLATGPTTTEDERRRLLAQTISAGLAPFVARRGDAARLRITAAEGDDHEKRKPAPGARDPWRAWVFELGASVGTSGDANYRSTNADGSLEARRVTEAWKVELEGDLDYVDDRFTEAELDSLGNVVSEEVFKNLRRSWDVEGLLVRSLGSHPSAGLRGELRSDTYL